MTRERTGRDADVLVISVWHENEGSQGFRARLIFESDEQQALSSVLATPEAVLDAVTKWLTLHAR